MVTRTSGCRPYGECAQTERQDALLVLPVPAARPALPHAERSRLQGVPGKSG